MKGILQKKNESLLIFDILKIHMMKKKQMAVPQHSKS